LYDVRSGRETMMIAPHGDIRIAHELHENDGVRYGFECPESAVSVRFARCGATATHEWRVEARTSEEADALVVTACDSTRVRAFIEVGRWWTSHAELYGLPRVDWAAIWAVLRDVRAL
jgi:hypothetical protein